MGDKFDQAIPGTILVQAEGLNTVILTSAKLLETGVIRLE